MQDGRPAGPLLSHCPGEMFVTAATAEDLELLGTRLRMKGLGLWAQLQPGPGGHGRLTAPYPEGPWKGEAAAEWPWKTGDGLLAAAPETPAPGRTLLEA